MTFLLVLVVAFGLSFLGSIPIGLITLTITERTISKGFRAGLMVGLGATIFEFIYTFLAIAFLEVLTENIAISKNIKIVSIVIFSLLAIYYFLKKSNPTQNRPLVEHEKNREFYKGVIVGAMNMLIVPYWLLIGVWLKSNDILINNISEILIFSLGAALGAFAIFIIYGKLAQYVSGKIDQVADYTNKCVGALFLVLALIQFLQLI